MSERTTEGEQQEPGIPELAEAVERMGQRLEQALASLPAPNRETVEVDRDALDIILNHIDLGVRTSGTLAAARRIRDEVRGAARRIRETSLPQADGHPGGEEEEDAGASRGGAG